MQCRKIREQSVYRSSSGDGYSDITVETSQCKETIMPSFDYIRPILLLLGSNVFMTFAWYGHLKFGNKSLMLVILVSWIIAFFEYCLAVPANRYGHEVYSAAQLKTIQEVITLVVFAGFSVAYLGEKITINHAVGFAMICGGAFFVFKGPL
jgi:uncharacterized protein